EEDQSYILFLNTAQATGITSVDDLETLQMSGDPFLRFNLDTLGLANGDLEEADLIDPGAAPAIDIDTLKTAVADDGVGTVFDYELAVVVLNDIATPGAGGTSIATEYI